MGNGWIQNAEVPIVDITTVLGMKSGRMNSVSPCPSCQREERGSRDTRGVIGLTSNGKGWRCHRCGAGGNSIDLVSFSLHGSKLKDVSKVEQHTVRDWFIDNGFVTRSSPKDAFYSPKGALVGRPRSKDQKDPREAPKSAPGRVSCFDWASSKDIECHNRLLADPPTHESVKTLDYLVTKRGLSNKTIIEWSLGLLVDPNGRCWVTIPLRNEHGQTVSIRYRSVPDGTDKKKEYRVCRERPLPLYGAHKLNSDVNSTVIIVEGEIDVLTLYQYGITENVVSGTKGAASNWASDWLDLIEPYSNFIIMYDDDKAGKQGSSKLAATLGDYRCSIATLPRNDANECLMNGDSDSVIHRALDRAKPFIKMSYSRPSDYGDLLEVLINNPSSLRGRPTGSARLDDALGGLRDELVVLTGDTGHGKTTFATWLCYEQAKLGIPVLLTSFEQKPIGTVQKLLRTEIGGDFTECSKTRRQKALSALDRMPIHILNHYGEATFEQVCDAIRYAKRRYGVRVALVDHLGFLSRGAGDTERQRIEEIVRKLATVAVNDGLTILLICHPNRMSKGQQRRVMIGDLKGASAIEQDAHTGIVIERLEPSNQRGFPCAAVHIDKVRSEFGHPSAKVTLCFDPLASTFADKWEYTPSGAKGMTIQVPTD